MEVSGLPICSDQRPSDIVTGASGCIHGNAGEQHLWVTDLLKRPIGMTVSRGTLIWKSEADSLTFGVTDHCFR